MPISTLKGYPRIGGVIGYGPVEGSGVWKLQERYALADDFYDDVSLLLKMNGANGSTTFLDSSQFGHAVTANGNAAISTTESKFGGSSLALDGTGDYATVAANESFNLGAGDFTVEAWAYFADLSQGLNVVGYNNSSGAVSGTNVGWNIDVPSSSQARFYFYSGSTQYVAVVNQTINTNTWYHIAAVRLSGNVTVFLNGVAGSPASLPLAPNTPSGVTLNIGRWFAASSFQRYMNGYIDSLRITKGQARYTAAFTPPQRDFLP